MAGFARATGMRSGRPLANDAHDKQWYTLVKLDEYGGVGHVVSDRELQELEDLILSGEDPSDDSSFNDGQTLSGDESREDDSVDGEEPYSEDTGPLRLPVQVAAHQKPGGPCDHCGAQDSPQWRRGPASKPMLCNACGTRYRRTNNLGPSTPLGRVAAPPHGASHQAANIAKKRSPPVSPSSTLNPGNKKGRCGTGMNVYERYGAGVRA